MKAKVIETGEIIDVVEIPAFTIEDAIPFARYFVDINNNLYDETQLELDTPEKPKEVVLEGWIMRDDNYIPCLYLNKPTCDEDGDWDLTGESYELSRKLFPDITSESEPKKYRITITPL
ncbi:MAG: hypothetical protein K2K45_07670 [Muribaculaceae bacterium]|nr:hypothetical protein [Muribaculaceae bacterium]